MAFPTVVSRQSSEESAIVTTHDIPLPATVDAGDLLIIKLGTAVAGGITIDWSGTGFTMITNSNIDVGGSGHHIEAAYKWADGSEDGTTVSPTSSVGSRSIAQVLRITGAENPSTQAPEAASNTNTNLPSNPPSLTPTGGAKDYLWIACSARDRSDETHDITGAPTNYSNLEALASASTGAGFCVGATAERQLNAASEDPGAFTDGGGIVGEGCGLTIAVHPATAVAAAAQVRSISALSGVGW